MAALGFVACVMVVVGFKAKFSAIMLVVILSVFNLLVNNFWTVSISMHYRKNWRTLSTDSVLASRTSPTQGFCQVRFLPNSLYCRRSPPSCQQWAREVQYGREKEGLLDVIRGVMVGDFGNQENKTERWISHLEEFYQIHFLRVHISGGFSRSNTLAS